MDRRLIQGTIYNVKCLTISPSPRAFPAGDGTTKYSWKMTFSEIQDPDIIYNLCDYVLRQPTQNDFKVGETYHIMMNKSWAAQNRPDEIMLATNTHNMKEYETPTQYVDKTVNESVEKENSRTRYVPASTNISGSSRSFALAYAKDITGKRIEVSQLDMSEKDIIDSTLRIAKEFEKYLNGDA